MDVSIGLSLYNLEHLQGGLLWAVVIPHLNQCRRRRTLSGVHLTRCNDSSGQRRHRPFLGFTKLSVSINFTCTWTLKNKGAGVEYGGWQLMSLHHSFSQKWNQCQRFLPPMCSGHRWTLTFKSMYFRGAACLHSLVLHYLRVPVPFPSTSRLTVAPSLKGWQWNLSYLWLMSVFVLPSACCLAHLKTSDQSSSTRSLLTCAHQRTFKQINSFVN